MSILKAAKNSLVIASIFSSHLSWAISKEMHALVRMETHSNAVATRDSGFTRLEHYEIPLKLIEADVALRSNPEFVSSLIFERNGEKFVRWVINPEDTKWYLQVEEFLKKNGIEPVRKKHFIGYMTASRSYIAVDPKSGAEFSVKVSTDRTGGNWRDKQQTWDDGKQIRLMTDFVDKQLKGQPKLEHIVLLDEPMAFGIKDIDQGMIIRSYEEVKKSGKRYVPGFSIMHEDLGRDLAKANGSKDPAAYWNEHYNKPLARALAEFYALTGMTYDSPHSQNFLVELDAKNRPTGKIVLRDFGDTYLSNEFFEAVKRTDITKAWEQSNLLKGYMSVSVGILHGNTAPSWMDIDAKKVTKNNYNGWGLDFFKEFEKEFARQTGVQLNSSKPHVSRNGLYLNKGYIMNDEAAKRFLDLSEKGLQRDNLMIRSCSRTLLAI